MKLESKKHPLLPFKRFIIRQLKYGILAVGLIAFSLGIGILGYRYYENLSWIDSFYMSSMILTGMGPVSEMTNEASKIFSSFYAIFSGVIFLSITAVLLSPVVHRFLHIIHLDTEIIEKENHKKRSN